VNGVRSRGLAREGAQAICHEAFDRIAAPSVVARIAPANAASLGVAGAIGMIPGREGQGRFGEPIAVLRLSNSDWRTRSDQGQPG
jgi:RimJ/RimL family protein N-acetyltransferase